MWAASRLGLAGIATEADIAAGAYSLLATGGSFLAARLGGSAAEASFSAVRLAGRLAAAGKAAVYADSLAHGALLGWEAYLDVVSGRVPWGEIADAALLAAGPVAARVKPLAAALAGGGAVMLYLGEPFNAAAFFADELYAAASEHGEYAGCFVEGALQAFSTYAQEVEAARWVGIASTIVDIPSLLDNKYWLGYRQHAALSAFPRNHGPIIPSGNLFTKLSRNQKYIAMNHRRFGFSQNEEPRFFRLSVGGLVLKLSPGGVSYVDAQVIGGYVVRVYKFGEGCYVWHFWK